MRMLGSGCKEEAARLDMEAEKGSPEKGHWGERRVNSDLQVL